MGIAQLIECDVANVEVEGLSPSTHTNYLSSYPCGCSASGNTSGFQPEIESSILSRRTNYFWEILDINT